MCFSLDSAWKDRGVGAGGEEGQPKVSNFGQVERGRWKPDNNVLIYFMEFPNEEGGFKQKIRLYLNLIIIF